MRIKATNMTRYWRPISAFHFFANKISDRHVVAMTNALAKEIGICPQTTAREALSLGLVELARVAGVDLGKVVLTENAGTGEKHLELFYPAAMESQENSATEGTEITEVKSNSKHNQTVNNQAAMTA